MTKVTKKGEADIVELRPTFRNADEHGIWANTYWDIFECDNASDPAKLEAACKKAAAVADALIIRLQQRTPEHLNRSEDDLPEKAIERTVDKFLAAFEAADGKKAEREEKFRAATLVVLDTLARGFIEKSLGEPAPPTDWGGDGSPRKAS